MSKLDISSPKYPDLFCEIDQEDFANVSQYKWYFDGKYVARNIRISPTERKRILLHRFLLSPADSQIIDHINGDPLDNRRSNLRPCTSSQNSMNKRGRREKKSSYKGVCPVTGYTNKWQAKIWVNKKNIQIGTFETQEEAARAYNKAAINFYGSFAKLNEVVADV